MQQPRTILSAHCGKVGPELTPAKLSIVILDTRKDRRPVRHHAERGFYRLDDRHAINKNFDLCNLRHGGSFSGERNWRAKAHVRIKSQPSPVYIFGGPERAGGWKYYCAGTLSPPGHCRSLIGTVSTS